MNDIALIFVVVLGAYFVRGLVGFGSGMIAVPLLALVYPLPTVVPAIMALDFAASLALSGIDRRHADFSEVASLLPFGAIGALVGVWGLINLPSGPLLLTLGVFVAFFGLRYLFALGGSRAISRLWAAPAGLLGSMTGGMFGTSAPPYVIYLTHRLGDKTRVRATFSVLFVVDGGFRLILMLLAGLFSTTAPLMTMATGVPAMMLGLALGSRLHGKASNAHLSRVTGGLLILAGLSLILKVAFHG